MRRMQITIVILTAAFFVNSVLNVYAQGSPETIVGDVTYVDLTMLRVNEDITQTAYTFSASPAQLKNIKPGYRVEVKALTGKVLSITVLGMPMQASPEPSQKWKVLVR
jgi:hypothetical protein